MQRINNQATRSVVVTGLDKNTEYEFQILALSSAGDGPKSTVVFKKTKEAAPSRPPSHFNIAVDCSTSITASWQLPPEGSRHGIIKGYRLYYEKKGLGFATFLTVGNGNTSLRVTKLYAYTGYEFLVLAFTSAGDGPNSSTIFATTMEDAPSAPMYLSSVDVPPSNLHGPRITLSWSKPAEPNGLIRSYTLFYNHGGGTPKEISGIDKDASNHTVDVLGGVTYQFHVRAVTIKPGPNETITVTTQEYVSPIILKEVSPSSVICKKQTLCLLSCQATSYIPFNYSWTKDGQVPIGDTIKIMNNSIIVTPRDAQDYGEFVCHVTNGFGSTEYKITLLENNGTQSILLGSVIALSCLVVVSLIMNGVFIWQRRGVVSDERILSEEKVDSAGVKSSPDQQPSDEQASDPSLYMELKPRPLN